MSKPTLHLCREMWDDLSATARADIEMKYEVRVNQHYYGNPI